MHHLEQRKIKRLSHNSASEPRQNMYSDHNNSTLTKEPKRTQKQVIKIKITREKRNKKRKLFR